MTIYSPNEFVLSQKHPVGIVGWRADVKQAIPHAIEAVLEGERVLVVKHGRDETRVLQNLGIAVPNPILWRYDWCGQTPFESQKITAAMLVSNRSSFVLNDMGTGKTRAALFAFDFLQKEGLVRKMLVLAPLSTLRQTWAREVARFFPHLRVVVVYGDASQRAKLLQEPADIYVTNHDAVRIYEDAFKAAKFDVLLVDELTAYKTAASKRSRAARRLAAGVTYRWGMTGSPTAKGPEDAHGQVLLIHPENMPSSAMRWKDRTMLKVSTFRYVPRADAMDQVYRAMQPSVRFKREEVIELPPVSYLRRDAEMSPIQAQVYKQVLTTLRSQLSVGAVNAANEGVKLQKLLQISSGFVYTDGGAAGLDPAYRMQVILEAIEEAHAKFLVFSPFVAGVEMIADHLTKEGLNVGKIHGGTAEWMRNDIFDAFRDAQGLDGIVAHPATMSHGLTLTEADLIVWAAPIASLETYEQANARITRPGQTRKQLIVQVCGSPVEARVYKRLDDRSAMQGALLEMFDDQDPTDAY